MIIFFFLQRAFQTDPYYSIPSTELSALCFFLVDAFDCMGVRVLWKREGHSVHILYWRIAESNTPVCYVVPSYCFG